jgi:SAM-dependent methyltransferase
MKPKSVVDYYDYIYSWKQYATEAARIKEILQANSIPKSATILEWACGTGRYLEHFKEYNCIGVDLCERSLELAAQRAPDAKLFLEDMTTHKPTEPVNVILGLFGAIGYLDPKDQLQLAIQNAYDLLGNGGVLIIEPWVSESNFRSGEPHLQIYRSLNLQIARMVTPDQLDMKSILKFEFLIGRSGAKIEHLLSTEELWLCETDHLNIILEEKGFRKIEIVDGFMPYSSLWICLK